MPRVERALGAARRRRERRLRHFLRHEWLERRIGPDRVTAQHRITGIDKVQGRGEEYEQHHAPARPNSTSRWTTRRCLPRVSAADSRGAAAARQGSAARRGADRRVRASWCSIDLPVPADPWEPWTIFVQQIPEVPSWNVFSRVRVPLKVLPCRRSADRTKSSSKLSHAPWCWRASLKPTQGDS